jgi:carboxypeptidase Q
MRSLTLALGAASLVAVCSPLAAAQSPLDARIAAVADAAQSEDRLAWNFVEGITTEVGPRQAGTEAEARGRAWAVDWLRAHGFARITVEPFPMSTWIRGEERAEIVAPFAQPMRITALGNSASTGEAGLTAEVVRFPSYAALEAAPAGSLAGKIAFIDHAMQRTQDGSHYGVFGNVRRSGPSLAASKGAAGVVIRSIGTESHRTPHTGGTSFAQGVTPIPAGALSNPDADNLGRMFDRARGRPVAMKLVLTPRDLGETESGNVVAEVTGRDPALPPLLLACHLDSWDLGTGPIVDRAGAAARRVAEAGQPLRTIRVLFAGAEETGLWGSKAHAAAHKGEAIYAGLESDFGADRIWRIDSNFSKTDPALYRELALAVARFGVAPSGEVATGGADLNLARESNAAIIDLQQDGTRYFDLHHTADDTLDKIDPAALRQNVAVWTQVVGILANRAEPIARGE